MKRSRGGNGSLYCRVGNILFKMIFSVLFLFHLGEYGCNSSFCFIFLDMYGVGDY